MLIIAHFAVIESPVHLHILLWLRLHKEVVARGAVPFNAGLHIWSHEVAGNVVVLHILSCLLGLNALGHRHCGIQLVGKLAGQGAALNHLAHIFVGLLFAAEVEQHPVALVPFFLGLERGVTLDKVNLLAHGLRRIPMLAIVLGIHLSGVFYRNIYTQNIVGNGISLTHSAIVHYCLQRSLISLDAKDVASHVVAGEVLIDVDALLVTRFPVEPVAF